jgi:hypothetical protein
MLTQPTPYPCVGVRIALDDLLGRVLVHRGQVEVFGVDGLAALQDPLQFVHSLCEGFRKS